MKTLACDNIKANEPTKNGLIFTDNEMKRVIELFKNKQHSLFGEFITEKKDSCKVDLKYVSHEIMNLTIFQGKFIVELELTPTIYGKMLNKLGLEFESSNFEIYPRFLGTVDENNYVEVTDVIAFDIRLKEEE